MGRDKEGGEDLNRKKEKTELFIFKIYIQDVRTPKTEVFKYARINNTEYFKRWRDILRLLSVQNVRGTHLKCLRRSPPKARRF